MKYSNYSSSHLQRQYSVFPPYSPTVLKDFLRCPRYWRLRYIEGRGISAGPVLNFAITFHEFAARVSRRVLAGDIRRGDLARKIEECARETFEEAAERGLLRPEEKATFLDRCRNTMPMFIYLTENCWQGVEVEYYGAVDRRYAPSRPSDADRLQLYIYGLLIFRTFREFSEISAELFFAGDRGLFRVPMARSAEGRLRGMVEDLIRKIESEREFGPRPGGHCRWCVFRGEC